MNVLEVKEIKDYYNGKIEIGTDTDCFGIITHIGTKKTKENSVYTFFTLEDKTAPIHVKAWEVDLTALGFTVGSFVKVRASLDKWKRKTQLITKINIDGDLSVTPVEEKHQKSIEDYIPSSPVSCKHMLDVIRKWIAAFKDKELAALCLAFFKTHQRQLCYFPGALHVHHAYKGGLLHHIYSMGQRALLECELKPILNKELLLTGVFLHDMGKFEELGKVDPIIGRAADYSKKGVLLGHIALGLLSLSELVKSSNLSISEATLLKVQHIIASHHYDEMMGALQKPSFLEAEIVHHLDLLDSRENIFSAEVRCLVEEEIGPKVPFLEQRRILRSDFVSI